MIQFASVTGFLRTILIILLVWYGMRVLARIFTPLLMRYVAKKAEKQFGQQFNRHHQPKESKKKEGEISIDKMPKQKTSNKDVGEYVDYEEID